MRRNAAIVVLTICLAFVFNAVHAQKASLTISVYNRPVSEILEMIEKQTSFLFVYDAQRVDVSYRFTLHVQEKSLFDVLHYLFSDTHITFTVINKQIILSRKETVEPDRQAIVLGTVTDDQGIPVIGANIVIRGTSLGTTTDVLGNFKLKVPLDSTLQISYIGYHPQQLLYTGQQVLKITLIEDIWNLDEIVVTALGIRKREASLTYASQALTGVDIARVRSQHLMNSLSGKITGVQINRSSAGLGGSARVIIRGSRSINGNNQPLYVIDGVPTLNTSNEQANSAIGGTANAANRDGGDGISNLNPDDIENMTILKGASASALYGSQAANGVILITTKSGKAGVKRVEYSSNLLIDRVTHLPAFQNDYGRAEGSTHSWGDRREGPASDNLKDFFQTGISAHNALSFSSGNEKMQAYFSYANQTIRGIIDDSHIKKHNITFREKTTLFDDRLSLDGSVNLVVQNTKNKPTSGGIYMNPLYGLYTFPRGVDLSPYKKQYEVFDPERNMGVQNWFTEINDYDQNPYWLTHRMQSNDKRFRVIGSLTAAIKVNDHLVVQARGSIDHIDDAFQQKIYASTSPGIAGTNGRYIDYNYQETLIYGDIMATWNRSWGDFDLQAVVGSTLSDNRVSSLRLDSKTASLYYPNVFTIANIQMSSSAFIDERNDDRRQLQSVFATFLAGYKEKIYLDVSARNDWSSTLAFTQSRKTGYFYPSVGLAWIMHHTFDLPEWVSFGKLRASWSQVGNDIPLFVSTTVSHIGAGGSLLPSDIAPFGDLKPEMSSSVEVGTEWRLLANRLSFDFTFYQTNTRNQLFTLPSSAGATHKYYAVNAGNIRNRGLEISLSGSPVVTNRFVWRSALNYSKNTNRVKALHKDLPAFVYGDEGFSSSYSMRLVEGGSFGDIYGKAFDRDPVNGEIKYGSDGIPVVIGDGNTIRVGNCNPDFLLGWHNVFSYRDFSFSFLLDGRFGGSMLSQTQAVLDQKGVSKRTGEARLKGYVELEGRKIEQVKDFFEQIGGRSGATEYYMYDATHIRLRELSIGYSLPKKWMEKTKYLQQVQIALIGRNLFFLYKDAPFDPDVVLSTENNNQGIEVFGMPSTRSMGLNLKVTL
ncbi:SusC/RagA family TonB-linked outer membrane protein [Parabacteroides sp. PF5-6]|uniref:SusC/RagA family TonB-linked outer membrane protein n=1 Tax=Parabacteroides sp. PF5-6 TaxID=1742403 RepID=UPI002406151D|nr:SusC/RagA family TonB-linked outer membrane protein [Parabacteroides sp. PF5-6]MDF9830833.1 TonB-linked SusC/RagA family outer membrane protein [Parabacteroides sp. PF5-6]